jgi:hypothetical protein
LEVCSEIFFPFPSIFPLLPLPAPPSSSLPPQNSLPPPSFPSILPPPTSLPPPYSLPSSPSFLSDLLLDPRNRKPAGRCHGVVC